MLSDVLAFAGADAHTVDLGHDRPLQTGGKVLG